MITRNFNLYLNAGHSVPLVINVNQYDSGEQWVFTLYNADGTKYTPSTGAIVGIKSDGLGIINSGSVVDGNVVINETQQMTAAVGKAVFELLIDSQTHGTANFVVLVEEKPGNNADLSESDLSLLQEAIDATSPLPTGGSVGQVLTKIANGSTWSDAGTPTQEQVADAVSDWADEHITVSTGVVIDTSLAVAGAAADAKKTGDEIGELKNTFNSGFEEAESVNKFNGNLTTGYTNTSGAVNSSATDYAYTDKIPVPATTFVITADNLNARRLNVPCRYITAYDADQNVLSTYGQQTVGSDNSFIDTAGANIITLDASVKYIVISIYKPTAKFRNICVSFNTSITEYVPYGSTTKLKDSVLADSKQATIANYLSGKTVAVFGDSIMYGAGSDSKGAVDLLAEKYGMTVAKYCVSGSTMGIRTDDPQYTVDEAHHIAKQVRNAIAANISPDLIVFNGGTNDIGGGITIGTMSEVYTQPASESYFADGFETVAYLLMKNFVGVPMIYMRAHNMSSRSYTGQIDYGELGNKIAEKWGIRTVDMYKRMNTQLAEYRTAYLADYTHPNEAGYNKYYVPALEDFVFYELA